ncbi:GATOR1 complex protein NPRL3 [Planococcus citri]|uniref:GATOR1 complex protein NPRL3 n=1 Tax=Planococcus citri TaxID=170843 RepID=UPI0031F8B368
MDIDPIGIFLVKNDSNGDKLLFRYPYLGDHDSISKLKYTRHTPYSLHIAEDTLYGSNITKNEGEKLTEFSDELLSNLFSVKPNFSDHKFELKINNIRFVGHPTFIKQCFKFKSSLKKEETPSILVHVVFALKASAEYSVVKSYYDLSRRIGVAIRHEEKRCGYFGKEMKLMTSTDEMISSSGDANNDTQSSFDVIASQCSLARNLKYVYESLCSTGKVHFRLNNWIEVSFCLTQKAHSIYMTNFTVSPEDIDRCLQNLKPYHGLLLLEDINTVLNSLPPDASPSLIRFLKVYSPLKNFQMISADSDLTIAQVFNLIGHFLNWGSAMIIYPLCESNIYVIAPGAGITSNSPLTEKFAQQFPEHNLLEVMEEFSLPSTMVHKLNPLTHPEEQAVLVQMVAWMLRHRLLMQLHTYVYFMPTKKGMVQAEELHPISHSRYQSFNTNFGQSGSDLDTYSLQAPSDSDISSVISEDFAKTPMTTFQTELNSWLNISIMDETDKVEDLIFEDEFITRFSEEEKNALLKIPASSSPEDFHLLMRLLKQGYLQGTSHMEEIMYLENIRRSQLVQLFEKFQDILITCESADPAVSIFYPEMF